MNMLAVVGWVLERFGGGGQCYKGEESRRMVKLIVCELHQAVGCTKLEDAESG
jgi:hypothetical protein